MVAPMLRRLAAPALAALLVLAAGPSPAQPSAAPAARDGFERCIAQLRRALPRHPEVDARSFDRHVAGARDLRGEIRALARSQPEFQLPVWEYVARLVDERRIADGARRLRADAPLLERLARERGVEAPTLLAVFGIETDYGRLRDRHRVIDATLSRACLAPANREREAQFFAALRLLQAGQVTPEGFVGSWAGAFGLTQFMPATHLRHMADGDGDGRIDTLGNPADALATTARYLRHLGWTDGLPWGLEVQAPADVARLHAVLEREHACLRPGAPAGAGGCHALGRWAALGVVRADGQPLPVRAGPWPALGDTTPMALLTPAGPRGPAWLVTANFHALWNYNRSDAYALSIGLLSDALRGGARLQAAWPSDEARQLLSRDGLAELQQRLRAAGHCEVVVDGYDGPLTRAALRREERRRGLEETGRPLAPVLEALRQPPPAGAAVASPCPEPVAAAAAAPPEPPATATTPAPATGATPDTDEPGTAPSPAAGVSREPAPEP